MHQHTRSHLSNINQGCFSFLLAVNRTSWIHFLASLSPYLAPPFEEARKGCKERKSEHTEQQLHTNYLNERIVLLLLLHLNVEDLA